MRTTVIVCSIVGAVALVVLGGLFNAVSGFGFDTLSPYNDPVRVVVTLVGATPGFIVALIGLGYTLYDAARRGAVGWFIGLVAWPFVPILAASLMFAGALSHAIYWFLPLAVVPLAPLVYVLAVPTAAAAPPEGKPAAASRPRLAVFIGILVVVVVGGGALLFPRPSSGNTGPSGPPALTVTQSASSADCANGIYPAVTLTNTGSQALQWTASSQDSNVTASPSSGSLAPGGSATVSFSGKTSAPDVIVQFQAGGQGAPAKFGCQSGASK